MRDHVLIIVIVDAARSYNDQPGDSSGNKTNHCHSYYHRSASQAR